MVSELRLKKNKTLVWGVQINLKTKKNMTICSNASIFNQQGVEDYSEKNGIQNPSIAYRIRTDWDSEHEADYFFKAFLEDPKLPQIKNIIIGLWEKEACDVGPDDIVDLIMANKDKLQHIEGLFMGDITYEENEMSWIENLDYGPLLAALPNLKVFRVRGGNNLRLSNLKSENLKQLIIETGGISKKVINDVATADLPNLEHLELWIGTENYGLDASAEEVATAYRGVNANHLPALKYLGLRNSEDADESAKLLMDDPIMDRIEELDFSKGVIGDEGAEALLNNPKIKNLKKLNLAHNFISDEWAKKLETLGIEIDLSDREPNPGEYDRYVEVGE